MKPIKLKSNSGNPIPPEIWIRIITFLRVPIPLPLSCPPRSALRQEALTVVARVSKVSHVAQSLGV